MLVLARKATEGFTIGDDVVVRVCSIEGYKVKLGVEAPRNVVILREEVPSVNIDGGTPLDEKSRDILARCMEVALVEVLKKSGYRVGPVYDSIERSCRRIASLISE